MLTAGKVDVDIFRTVEEKQPRVKEKQPGFPRLQLCSPGVCVYVRVSE